MGMPPNHAWPFRRTPTPVALAVAMVCGGHRRQIRAHFSPQVFALAVAMVCGGHCRQIRAHFSPQVYVHYLRSLRNGR